jgi:isopentenyl diphosphate isomerase/L-lactate dehydrogenase-like FMN-dependent dehydrogenase
MSRQVLPSRIDEWEDAARAVLPEAVFDYFAGGAEDEVTLRANRMAWQHVFLRPRVLVDVSDVDTSVTLLGQRLAHPVLLAPAAFQRLANEEGECASARAARRSGTLIVASSLATCSVEEISSAAPGPFWLQVYVFRNRDLTRELVGRAIAAGATALCLTVTVPVQGGRERDARNRFSLPPGMEMANFRGYAQAHLPANGAALASYIHFEFDASLSWKDLDWLCAISSVPVLVKGIMTPEDACLALEHGAAGVIVSNHGGRQLDGAEPTAIALPQVAKAIGGRAPVLVDGGIRRGSDVVKALALGANAVLIARPYLWGLALAGEDGVLAALEQLRAETARTLALVGITRATEVGRELLSSAGWKW